MTNNMKLLYGFVSAQINVEYSDALPSLEAIESATEQMRTRFINTFPISDDEFDYLKRKLESDIRHTISEEAITLKGQDSSHLSWYYLCENDGYYWNRYREYLKNIKHWGIDIVNKINKNTDNIMDDLGNPRDKDRAFQRRGLLLGDVQSGKTATYTAICNKAADAGYRIIIVLAGMTEALRVQTQLRLDTEFIGHESKLLDNNVKNERGKSIGVGRIAPFNQDKKIAYFTSINSDFNKTKAKQIGINLRVFMGTALFVVKKNKSVLNNLCTWLMDNNADQASGLIDLPLLLIDDEADNASINTNSDDKDPTAINNAIRDILNGFRQASYLGITATPFANIFINPTEEQDAGTRDLFPKDFLTVLPDPEKYIGPNKIFGSGNADDWQSSEGNIREKGMFNEAIIPIANAEQANYFVFKHKKWLANSLYELPPSLKEAIRYFVLVTGISDLRNDINEHRSMLINVSRFITVQNKIAELVEEFVEKIKLDVENYSQIPAEKASEISSIASLKLVWEKYNLSYVSGTNWSEFLKTYLHKSIRRIIIRSVNSKNGASSLNYDEFKNVGMRVIAVGGNCLSRGLTLEGLCVSYFYRNTMMYDTLLQMGRWFGYRFNYEDLFKIWMGEDLIDWYGYITDAVDELKDELRQMEREGQTPSQFGLKVRQAPGALLVTARNKMRFARPFSRLIRVSGRILETTRLRRDKKSVESNEQLCRNFIKTISDDKSIEGVEYNNKNKPSAFIWRKVPKDLIVSFVKGFVCHPWNLDFQSESLANYINEDDDQLKYWDVAIPQSKFEGDQVIIQANNKSSINVNPKKRPLDPSDTIQNMLKVYGQHVRIGSDGGETKIGLTSIQVEEALRNRTSGSKDSAFLNVFNRQPLLLIYVLQNTSTKESRNDDDPQIAFALGLCFPGGEEKRTANYLINTVELQSLENKEDADNDDEDVD